MISNFWEIFWPHTPGGIVGLFHSLTVDEITICLL